MSGTQQKANNQFYVFACGPGADVIAPGTYAADTFLQTGFTTGIADPAQFNTVLRQSSFVSATFAQFIADQSGQSVLDNGNSSAFEAQMLLAIQNVAAAEANSVASRGSLGYTPVQQGGGGNQGTNKVYMGYSTTGSNCVRVTIDTTDLGDLATTTFANSAASAAQAAAIAYTNSYAETPNDAQSRANGAQNTSISYTNGYAFPMAGGEVTGSLFGASYIYVGSNGNTNPNSSAATGCVMAGGTINAYNASGGSAGLFGVTGNSNILTFYCSGNAIGAVYSNGSSVSYNQTSDYRLKDNVAVISGALDKVNNLRAVNYNWKSDPEQKVYDGFIAHEIAEVLPNAVIGVKNGTTIHKGVVLTDKVQVYATGVSEEDFTKGQNEVAALYPAGASYVTATAFSGKSGQVSGQVIGPNDVVLDNNVLPEQFAERSKPKPAIYPAGYTWKAEHEVADNQTYDPAQLLPVAWAAIQELSKQISGLQAELAGMKAAK